MGILGGGLQIDVATMVAWSLKKKEAEKKADPKAAALPFYKRFTRKQTLLGLLIFSLILSVLAVVTWYVVYQLELLPAGVHASFTPSPPPSSSAKGWGPVDRLNMSEASHQHELGQSQTMEDLKKSTNRGNLNFLKVPQTKRPRSIHARSS